MAKRKDRRSEIIRRAAHVFLQHGYDATSMNLIAEKAQVTKPGLYYHFKSKQELLFSIMSLALESLEKESLAATLSSADSEERLRRIIHGFARIITREGAGAFTLLVIDETKVLTPEDRRMIDHRKRTYFELVRAILDQLDKEGKLRSIDTTVGAFGLLGIVTWVSKWFRPEGRLSADEVADQITEMALAAVLKDGTRQDLQLAE